MKIIEKIHNFFFCLKYPFWKARNVFTGKFCGYGFTWYDDIPDGWKKAFGKQLSDEIKEAGEKYLKTHKKQSWKDILQWEQIKEKYGTLRLYASTIDGIDRILTRYELLSMCYCVECGKPVRYRSKGYIEYLCEDCAKKFIKFDSLEECKVTIEDIPDMSSYEKKYITSETFQNEAELIDRMEEYKKQDEKLNLTDDMVYDSFKNSDGLYTLQISQYEEVKTDIKKKYGVDFKELWHLD